MPALKKNCVKMAFLLVFTVPPAIRDAFQRLPLVGLNILLLFPLEENSIAHSDLFMRNPILKFFFHLLK